MSIQESMSSAEYRERILGEAPKSKPPAAMPHKERAAARGAPSRFRSTPTTVYGIRFGSKGEVDLFYWLLPAAAWILPHPRFPLVALLEDDRRCPAFTPDFLAETHGGIFAFEFKGPRATESRDYALRAAAFRKSYPSIPLRVFRRVKGELLEDAS